MTLLLVEADGQHAQSGVGEQEWGLQSSSTAVCVDDGECKNSAALLQQKVQNPLADGAAFASVPGARAAAIQETTLLETAQTNSLFAQLLAQGKQLMSQVEENHQEVRELKEEVKESIEKVRDEEEEGQ